MASQSTSISDLPRTDNQTSNEDIQESMMVNSILQDIENDEDLNDVNQESLQYSIDTSQIPPKIGNELPSVETIKETTDTIFNEFPTADELMEPAKNSSDDIDDFLQKKLEIPSEERPEKPIEKDIKDSIEDRIPMLCILIILFFLMSLPIFNNLIIKYIPKLSTDGAISHLGIFIKSLIFGMIYLACSFFI